VVEPDCPVIDTEGNCVCQLIDNSGRCIAGLGDDAATPAPQLEASAVGASSTTWITGGLIILLAFGVMALDKKGPAPIRSRAS
jgi:hypothetical protein